jgi:hypothetical protein
MCDNKTYRDAKKKAREPMSFHEDGSRIRILAIGYLAKIIRRLHVLQSPRFDHFAWVSDFFKPKAIRPVELAPVANTMIHQALQETAGAVPALASKRRNGLSALLSVVQVHPGLNIFTITQA